MAIQCGFPSATQFLEAIDSDEWSELLAFYELEYCQPHEPPKPSQKQVDRHLDEVLGAQPLGNRNRKT